MVKAVVVRCMFFYSLIDEMNLLLVLNFLCFEFEFEDYESVFFS